MKAFKIKTHRPGENYLTPHFFILKKGNNAGRPSHCPFNNSFVVFANSLEKIQKLIGFATSSIVAKTSRPG